MIQRVRVCVPAGNGSFMFNFHVNGNALLCYGRFMGESEFFILVISVAKAPRGWPHGQNISGY